MIWLETSENVEIEELDQALNAIKDLFGELSRTLMAIILRIATRSNIDIETTLKVLRVVHGISYE